MDTVSDRNGNPDASLIFKTRGCKKDCKADSSRSFCETCGRSMKEIIEAGMKVKKALAEGRT